ncbi:MAG: mandelate racemase/muconate lactonizing enzyme family protein [Chloroflexi bacterium]|nr:mandelate racemase/muconate lactonizing enzyme family protein [Chloroflexota bacterium]
MRVAGVAWRGFALPFLSPYVTSEGGATLKYGLLLWLASDDGLAGLGEASPIGPGSRGEVERTALALSELAPTLVGTAVENLAEERALGKWDMPAILRFGLETALLDLLGHARGLSLAHLLGGSPVALPVNAIIASESPRRAASEAARAVAQGFTSLKLKVAQGTLAQDVALVSAVRRAVGPSARLRVDANQGWSVLQAVEALRRLERYDLEYVEQPVAAADLAGMAEVRRSARVPVAADEALASPGDVERILKAEAADIFVVKAARLGGLWSAREVMRRIAEAGKAIVVTSSLESGVGLATSAHLASLLAAHPFAHGLATGNLFPSILLADPFLPRDSALAAPLGHGLGVRVDREQLERYATGIRGGAGVQPEVR